MPPDRYLVATDAVILRRLDDGYRSDVSAKYGPIKEAPDEPTDSLAVFLVAERFWTVQTIRVYDIGWQK